MAIVRRAIPKDFEETYPLFVKLNNSHFSKDDWRQLFVDHWKSNEGYVGYVLEDRKCIVGFLGLVFSYRILNGKKEKFCNLTSWVVDENFRNQSVFLILPILKLTDYTLTIHTASKETYAVAKKLGFCDLESHFRIIFPLPSANTFLVSCHIEVNGRYLNEILEGESLQVYEAHLKFRCFHVYVRSSLGNCYLIGARVFRKKIPFAQIYHISNSKVFAKFSSRIASVVGLKIKAIAMLVDERFLEGNAILWSYTCSLPNPRVYKSNSLEKSDLDLLYSELPILNI
jgi:RimJ/RimL family protein N-acetyltransferase